MIKRKERAYLIALYTLLKESAVMIVSIASYLLLSYIMERIYWIDEDLYDLCYRTLQIVNIITIAWQVLKRTMLAYVTALTASDQK